MHGSGFDQLAIGIGDALTRRGVLRGATLGMLALGLGLGDTSNTNAKRSKRSKKKGDVNKLCKSQVGQCEELLTVACGDDPQCLETVQTCCPKLSTCNFGGFFACLLVNQA